MTAQTLYDKLWNSHVVREEEDGTVLLYIDRHLVHEVTSPQAFEGLKMAGASCGASTASSPPPTTTPRPTIGTKASKTRFPSCKSILWTKTLKSLAHSPIFRLWTKVRHRTRYGPRTRRDPARYDRRLRRLAHFHPRRIRRTGARHRHFRSRAHDGDPVHYREKSKSMLIAVDGN